MFSDWQLEFWLLAAAPPSCGVEWTCFWRSWTGELLAVVPLAAGGPPPALVKCWGRRLNPEMPNTPTLTANSSSAVHLSNRKPLVVSFKRTLRKASLFFFFLFGHISSIKRHWEVISPLLIQVLKRSLDEWICLRSLSVCSHLASVMHRNKTEQSFLTSSIRLSLSDQTSSLITPNYA